MGGWTFEPWEGSFYPDKLAKAKQLQHASRQVRTIEVNGTYYSSFKPETFAKWAADAPEGFVFSLKAIRYSTNRKVLADGAESIGKFLASGITELGDKLGPILWQFAHTKKFDPAEFEGFLELLPERQDGVPLRHALEVRHDSFIDPEFVALAHKHGAAIVYAQHEKYPEIADVTGDFVYARLQRGSDDNPDCYTPPELDGWAKRAKTWAQGGQPTDLPYADPEHAAAKTPRDVFLYFISEGKSRAPFGAMALQGRVGS
jgi:uncharacterized protein YecE (DUF72 family)